MGVGRLEEDRHLPVLWRRPASVEPARIVVSRARRVTGPPPPPPRPSLGPVVSSTDRLRAAYGLDPVLRPLVDLLA